LAAVATFIDLHGDSRFSDLHGEKDDNVRERAGYWLDEDLSLEGELPLDPAIAARTRETRRIYLFTATGLKEASKGYDFKNVLSALDQAGVFTRKGKKQFSLTTRTLKGVKDLYYVDPDKLDFA
jgi:putative DNA primase/helicase